jgi:hypothetical protein
MRKRKPDGSKDRQLFLGVHENSIAPEQRCLPLWDKELREGAALHVDAKLRERLRVPPPAHRSMSRHIVVGGVIYIVRLRKGSR